MTSGAVLAEPVPSGDTDPDQTRTPLADLLVDELPASARWTVPGHMGGRCTPRRALDLLGRLAHAADLWPTSPCSPGSGCAAASARCGCSAA